MGSVLMDRILYLSFPSWGWIHPYAFGSFSRMLPLLLNRPSFGKQP